LRPVVLAAGGTAGHINPALAVAQALLAGGQPVLLTGTPHSLEEELAHQNNLAFTGFVVRGLARRRPWTFPHTLWLLVQARRQARAWLQVQQPVAVVTFGGYASLPVGLAASDLKLPLLVHEQNARPGLANQLLAGRATILALSDERARAGFRSARRIVVTGNPLRAELLGWDRAAARQALGLAADGRVLLVFGGSLGAHHLNTAVLQLAGGLLTDFPDLTVIHLTGSADLAWATEFINQAGLPVERWRLLAYSSAMGELYAAADLVLARAGATSLAEITALGKAALLVPYPYAAADEQTANAHRLVEAGAAEVWLDRELELPGFDQALRNLLTDAALRNALGQQAARLGRREATAAVVDLVNELIAGTFPASDSQG